MAFFTLNPILTPLSSSLKPNPPSSSSSCNYRLPSIISISSRSRFSRHVVRMAPEEEKLVRRSPLDFPIVRFFISSFQFQFRFNGMEFECLDCWNGLFVFGGLWYGFLFDEIYVANFNYCCNCSLICFLCSVLKLKFENYLPPLDAIVVMSYVCL